MNKKLKTIHNSYYFFYPGNINTKTGGYIYEKNIFDKAKKNNFKLNTISLSNNYPFPTKRDLKDLMLFIDKLPSNSTLIFDGLVFEAITSIIKKISNFKIIALIHHPLSLEFKGNQSREFLKREKKIFKIADKLFVTSQDTKKLLNENFKIDSKLIEVVEPGIKRLKKFKKNNSKKVTLLTCGSIIERKNYLYLLNELRFIDNVELYIIGDLSRDISYNEKIENLIKKYSLEQKVKFYENITNDNLARLYSKADFYVSASKYEGFGMSLANALILKKPIIAYKTKTILKTLGLKGVLYFNDFKVKNISKIVNDNINNKSKYNKIKSEIISNKRKFLTPTQSANLFIKGLKHA